MNYSGVFFSPFLFGLVTDRRANTFARNARVAPVYDLLNFIGNSNNNNNTNGLAH